MPGADTTPTPRSRRLTGAGARPGRAAPPLRRPRRADAGVPAPPGDVRAPRPGARPAPPHHPPTRPTDLAEDDTQELPPVAGARPADLWPTSAAGPADARFTDSGPANARFTDLGPRTPGSQTPGPRTPGLTGPGPANARLTGPGPANARLTGPGPANARFTGPGPANARLTGPGPANARLTAPGPANALPTAPGPANARPTDPEPADARPAATPAQLAPAQAAPRFAPAPRRTAVAVAVVAAVVGFGCALLLPGRPQAAATAHPAPPATDAPPAATAPRPTAPHRVGVPTARTPATDPDGPGTLRQGDTGPEVTGLQQRLLRIPDVYRDGSTHGTYDAALTEAVARFQLWYGISGDETGVYGDDTRRALESRTGFGDDA